MILSKLLFSSECLHGHSGQDGEKKYAQESGQLGGAAAGRSTGEGEGDGSTCYGTSSSLGCSKGQGVGCTNCGTKSCATNRKSACCGVKREVP